MIYFAKEFGMNINTASELARLKQQKLNIEKQIADLEDKWQLNRNHNDGDMVCIKYRCQSGQFQNHAVFIKSGSYWFGTLYDRNDYRKSLDEIADYFDSKTTVLSVRFVNNPHDSFQK